jgi:mRNA interferase MazF
MMISQGEIVLIPVPFTDLSSQKRRPVIVISNDTYNNSSRDFLVVALTSNPVLTPHSFTIDNVDLLNGSLNRPSMVRVDKIYTLEQTLVVKRFGRVNDDTLDRIRTILDTILSNSPSNSNASEV